MKYFNFLLLILTAGSLGFLFTGEATSIAQITCKTQYGPCSQTDEEKLQGFKGEQIFLFKTAKVSQIFSQDFQIREVFAHKIFPHKLAVFLELRKPLVALKIIDLPQSGFFLIDQDGFILAVTSDSPLPQVQVMRSDLPTQIGEKVSPQARFSALLVYSIFLENSSKLDLGQTTLAGILEKDKVLIRLGQTQAVFPTEGDSQALVGALQLIITRSKIDARLPKSIDLRYSNPVIIY